MRILLVTMTDLLPVSLTHVLNPALEYCAIVVDEPDIAKNMLKNVPPLRDKIFPFYELKECLEDNYFDFVLFISDGRSSWNIDEKFIKYGLPREKVFNLNISHGGTRNHILEKTLRCYKEHAKEFEMFATGTSIIAVGLDTNKFKYKLFNFGRTSQDLYYDYQVAKFILSDTRGGGGGNIKYALIGLSRYSFHYDLSKAYKNNLQLFQYYIAFKDCHNFWLPEEKIPSIFKKEFLSFRLPAQIEDINNVYGEKTAFRVMNWQHRLITREHIDIWKNKYYPETVKENIKILDDYLTLCEKNNVRPIIFLPPMTEGVKKYFNKKIMDEFYYLVHEAQIKHHGAAFLDGWKLAGFFDNDFYDAFHLNIQGAAKFSTILNNAIENLEKG